MKRQKRVVAIHDISCVGRCSLTTVLPILSATGINTCILPTAILSTHAGLKGVTYKDLSEDIELISKHWQSLDLEFDALYSGFLGSYKQVDFIFDLFDTFKRPNNLIMVDPVMADHGKLYSVYSKDIILGMKKLCKKGDIIVPNITEAAFMLGKDYIEEPHKKEYIEELIKGLTQFGNEMIVLTGVSFDTINLGVAFYSKKSNEISYYFSRKINGSFHGTGDIFASALLVALLNDYPLHKAVQIAVDYTCYCIDLTVQNGQDIKYGVCFEQGLLMLINRVDRSKNLGLQE